MAIARHPTLVPFDRQVDILQIPQATVSLVEATECRGKESQEIVDLAKCLRCAIREIETFCTTEFGTKPDS